MTKTPSKVCIELGKKLKSVYDDKGFVVSILSIVNTDEDRRALIDFIDKTPGVDIGPITTKATNLRRKRDGVPEYKFE